MTYVIKFLGIFNTKKSIFQKPVKKSAPYSFPHWIYLLGNFWYHHCYLVAFGYSGTARRHNTTIVLNQLTLTLTYFYKCRSYGFRSCIWHKIQKHMAVASLVAEICQFLVFEILGLNGCIPLKKRSRSLKVSHGHGVTIGSIHEFFADFSQRFFREEV